MIPDRFCPGFHEDLQLHYNELQSDPTEQDHIVHRLYTDVIIFRLLEDHNRTLVTWDQFKKSVNLETLRKAAKSPLNQKDLTAVIFHGLDPLMDCSRAWISSTIT